jgi:hypothetical protein
MIIRYDIAKCRESLSDLHEKISEYATTDPFFEEYELALYEYFEVRNVSIGEGEALDEFFRDEEEFERFMAWYSFCFVTDGHSGTFPILYRRAHRHQVSPFEEEILKSYDDSVLSLYEIQDVDPGAGFDLMNLFTGRTRRVQDVHYSRMLCKWDVMYAGLVSGRGFCFLGGFGAIVIPPRLKNQLEKDVLDLYEQEKKEYGTLDDFLRMQSAAVGALIEKALEDYSREPGRNSDGDLLCPTTLHYRVANPGAFTTKIRESPFFSRESFRVAGKLSPSDETYTWIRKARDGFKVYDTPPLGILTMSKNNLKVECNSRERAKRLRTLLDSTFHSLLQYRTTVYEDPDLRVPLWDGLQPGDSGWMDGNGYDHWFDEEVPALGGMTPREAAMTPDGRERLTDLMKELENENEKILRLGLKNSGHPVFPLDRIKKELGL